MSFPIQTLRDLEIKFSGGLKKGLRPPTNSPLDPVPNPKSVFHGHRMQTKESIGGKARNYAPAYAAFLPLRPTTIVELGVLRGVGLAIWCELFPAARVIGLDIDVSHFQENRPDLERRGAFRTNRPEVHRFDELAPDAGAQLSGILGGDLVDVFIDDALHYDAAILKAFEDAKPHLAPRAVYFVEDNFEVHRSLAAKWPEFDVVSMHEMTVLTRKP